MLAWRGRLMALQSGTRTVRAMRMDAEARRTTWLRRIHLLTGWIAAFAAAAALLIAAVVGSASPARKAAVPRSSEPRHAAARKRAVPLRHLDRVARKRATTPVHHRASAARVRTPVKQVQAPAQAPAPAPTPAPAPPPVVVSGGS